MDVLSRYPPPYALSCDVVLFPALPATRALQRWSGAPVLSLLGRSPLVIMAARYRHALYGPDRALLAPPAPGEDFYREVAFAVPCGLPWPLPLVFPHLWVDAPDSLPLDLGRRYGFPKYPAAIRFEAASGSLDIEAAATGGRQLHARVRALLPLPGPPFSPLSSSRGLFPSTGLLASLRFQRVQGASLCAVTHWDAPCLERLGPPARPRLALLLSGAELTLSAPAPLPLRAPGAR